MSGSNNGTPIGDVSALSSEGGTYDTHDLADIPELEIQGMDKNRLVPFLLANNVRFAWGDKEKRLRNFLLAKRREKVAVRNRRVEQERLEAERRERDEAEAAAAAAAEQQRLDDEAAAAAAAARDQRWMDEDRKSVV